MILVGIDGRTHWDCSQYVNSAATGRYMDYIVDEIVPYVEHRFRVGGSKHKRIIGGHSSGGFGALRVGISRPDVFSQVIALSPDSDFNVSHLWVIWVCRISCSNRYR